MNRFAQTIQQEQRPFFARQHCLSAKLAKVTRRVIRWVGWSAVAVSLASIAVYRVDALWAIGWRIDATMLVTGLVLCLISYIWGFNASLEE